MEYINGGVCAASGFKATGLRVGIKAGNTEKKDMAMVYSETPCKAAGTFTSNRVKAAPVKYDKETIEKSDSIKVVVVNSGVANACTGEEGMKNCSIISKETAKVAGVSENEVLTASTGVIGNQLPMDKIVEGIGRLYPGLGDGEDAAALAAEAIMTTDTISKQAAVKTVIGGKEVTVGGMCKGSGMIHINMCTMLGFITTDANISKEMLQKALNQTIIDTFNMVSVDGDTSTNDTVILLANGLAGNDEIVSEGEDFDKFKEALMEVAVTLSKKIAGDGEGATKLFEVKVVNAKTKEDARILSKAIISSNLSKAAIFGCDANFGRFLCAMGYSGVDFEQDDVELFFESAAGRMKVFDKGTPIVFNEDEALKILSEDTVTVFVDMNEGSEEATAWGCDLTYDYVKINADYRS